MFHKEGEVQMCNDNKNRNHSSMVETVIREGLIALYGETYTNLILDDCSIDSCDAEQLKIHVFSDFQAAVINTRLRTDIEKIVADVYNIFPDIIVVHNT
jgi:hypothetical protein